MLYLGPLVFTVENGRGVLVDVLVHAENDDLEVVVLDQQVVWRLVNRLVNQPASQASLPSQTIN